MRKPRFPLATTIACIATLVFNGTTLANDTTAGAANFTSCMACHGATADGNQMLKAPKLKHQHGWYLKAQINNFKRGVRGAHPTDINGNLCATVVKGTLTTDKSIDDVVAYIETLN